MEESCSEDAVHGLLSATFVPRAYDRQLLRSRKRNFSEAEVNALLRGVHMRRKKLLATPADGVPRWQRTLGWRQVTEAVNAASGYRNRRTTGEVKKKWSDIKIEAKKRHNRGDAEMLRLQDRRILSILDTGSSGPTDWDQGPSDQGPRVKQEPGLPTIGHVTTLKSEPQLSDSDPSSSPPPVPTEYTQTELCTERTQTSPRHSHRERAQCVPTSDLMVELLQNQQQILDALRNMADTFSQINSSLKDISHSLRKSSQSQAEEGELTNHSMRRSSQSQAEEGELTNHSLRRSSQSHAEEGELPNHRPRQTL